MPLYTGCSGWGALDTTFNTDLIGLRYLNKVDTGAGDVGEDEGKGIGFMGLSLMVQLILSFLSLWVWIHLGRETVRFQVGVVAP